MDKTNNMIIMGWFTLIALMILVAVVYWANKKDSH